MHTTPNVRLVAANALGAVAKSAAEGMWPVERASQVEMKLRPLLVEMAENDVDDDSKDAAKQALEQLPTEE